MDTAINMNEAIMDDAIARRWIAANAIALVAGAVCGLAGSGADALRAIETGDATTATKIAYWTVQIGLAVIFCAAYAMLTAPVFRSIIPALRSDLWLATHVAIGVVLGVGMASTFDGTDNREAFDWSGYSAAEIAFVVFLAAVAGAIFGAVIGGLQSMVWHRVARGSGFWIGMTALSGIVVVLILFAASPLLLGVSRLGFAVNLECAAAVAGLVSTLMMVPALRRLQPRG